MPRMPGDRTYTPWPTMVTECPSPQDAPSAGHTCATPSSPSEQHAQPNHPPLDDLETWSGDQSKPCHTRPETHQEPPYPGLSTPHLGHQNYYAPYQGKHTLPPH